MLCGQELTAYAMLGKAGRYISMDIGPKATNDPNKGIKKLCGSPSKALGILCFPLCL